MRHSNSTRVGPNNPTLRDEHHHVQEEHGTPQDNLTDVEQLTLAFMRREPWFADDPPNAPSEQADAGTARIIDYYRQNMEALSAELEQERAINQLKKEKNDKAAAVKHETQTKGPDDKSKDASSTSVQGNSSSSNVKTEPFPDYFESCEDENDPPVADREREEVYKLAMSKVYEETVRVRGTGSQVGAGSDVANDSALSEDTPTSAETYESNRPGTVDAGTDVQSFYDSEEDYDDFEEYSAGSSSSSASPASSSARRLMNHDNKEIADKARAIEGMRQLLNNCHIREPVRHLFHDLSLKVIRLETLIFHDENSASPEFLSAANTFEIRTIAIDITRYMTIVDNRLTELLEIVGGVYGRLRSIKKAGPMDVYLRYRWMTGEVLA